MFSGSRNESVSPELTRRNGIDVAPYPSLSGLDGSHQGMLALMKVLGGMPVLGRVAASHMSALKTKAKVDPRIAGFYTVLADVRVRMGDFDQIQVMASRHDWPSTSQRNNR